MKEENEKIIIFKNDVPDEKLGELCYVKFLNDNKTHAFFYKPLIAPKYFKEYISQNKIYEAYHITCDEVLKKYIDYAYTFTPSYGLYSVNKGVDISSKLILLVDKGMEIVLDLPIYSYVLKDDKFYVKELKQKPINKKYCYVCDSSLVNEELKKFMIPVYEAVPNILSINEYDFKHDIKTKKYETKKIK